jgi:hypothetical protein
VTEAPVEPERPPRFSDRLEGAIAGGALTCLSSICGFVPALAVPAVGPVLPIAPHAMSVGQACVGTLLTLAIATAIGRSTSIPDGGRRCAGVLALVLLAAGGTGLSPTPIPGREEADWIGAGLLTGVLAGAFLLSGVFSRRPPSRSRTSSSC